MEFKKTETFVLFKNMKIKIDRPLEIQDKDRMICIRAYEKLKGINKYDNWTKEADELFKKNNIKIEIAKEKEFQEYMKKAKDYTLRI